MTPDLFTAPARSPSSTTPRTRGKPTTFTVLDGEDVRTIVVRGRDAWALSELIAAGPEGCTPLEQIGPRWSHYVWKLRTVYGLNIETITELHGGEFSGHHARYLLHSNVSRVGGGQ
jgi:hypothetical protein